VPTAFTLDADHARHAAPGHRESPLRLTTTRRVLQEDGIVGRLQRLPIPEIDRAALERVHAAAYLDGLDEAAERLAAAGPDALQWLDEDTFFRAGSYGVAKRSAGGLLGLVDAVMTREAPNAMAVCRPPGHHARPGAAMGFCLLANAALAARHAQAVHGADRVLVIDFDVHHGNGTEEAFLDDPSVLALSSHHFPLWPGTGTLDAVGTGAGEGCTVNIPLPIGAGGDAVVALYRRVLPPLAERFRPDLIVVAAGYDAHFLDPIGGLALGISHFADLVRLCLEVADKAASGRIVFSLEGGYNPDVLAHGVLTTLRLLDDPSAEPSDPFDLPPEGVRDLSRLTADVLARHRLA
jgi:acetoin utilization deacetylase AcuC-like enzyme